MIVASQNGCPASPATSSRETSCPRKIKVTISSQSIGSINHTINARKKNGRKNRIPKSILQVEITIFDTLR